MVTRLPVQPLRTASTLVVATLPAPKEHDTERVTLRIDAGSTGCRLSVPLLGLPPSRARHHCPGPVNTTRAPAERACPLGERARSAAATVREPAVAPLPTPRRSGDQRRRTGTRTTSGPVGSCRTGRRENCTPCHRRPGVAASIRYGRHPEFGGPRGSNYERISPRLSRAAEVSRSNVASSVLTGLQRSKLASVMGFAGGASRLLSSPQYW